MKLPSLLQFRVIKQALRALFSKPYTTKFPKGPYAPVISFRGRPRFFEESCIGCGACAEVCPSKCIEIVDDLNSKPPLRKLIQHLDACIWCGQCERYCPTKAGIKMTNEYDCLGFAPEDFEEKVEKEILVCEICGGIIAPVDQLRWLNMHLGLMAYANPSLMMLAAKDLGIADPGVIGVDGEIRRGDRLSIQCPRCRKQTSLIV